MINSQQKDITAVGNARDNYLMKKITVCNNIDKSHHNKSGKNDIKLSIACENVDKLNENVLKKMLNARTEEDKKYLNDVYSKTIVRNNNPYKGIIKNFDYNKEINNEKDITIYKVNQKDKDASLFANNKKEYDKVKKDEDENIKKEYSDSKKGIHAKKFKYELDQKYAAKIDGGNDNIRVDRIEYYKKEQEKQDMNKKKIDNILYTLIDNGAISSNLNSINYDKIDTDSLEKTLKATFGEEEYKKMMVEMMKDNMSK